MQPNKSRNLLLCSALVSLLLWLSACGSGAIPSMTPQVAPTITKTILPTSPPISTFTPALPTPAITPESTTDTPNSIKENASQTEQIALPDLAVRQYPKVVFRPGTCGWNGGQITISFDNVGVANTGPFTVSIEGQAVKLDTLSAGSSAEASVPYEYALGGITAWVDSTEAITESDETNNFIGATFTPPPTCTSTPTATPIP